MKFPYGSWARTYDSNSLAYNLSPSPTQGSASLGFCEQSAIKIFGFDGETGHESAIVLS
jgi:hypothetical protein